MQKNTKNTKTVKNTKKTPPKHNRKKAARRRGGVLSIIIIALLLPLALVGLISLHSTLRGNGEGIGALLPVDLWFMNPAGEWDYETREIEPAEPGNLVDMVLAALGDLGRIDHPALMPEALIIPDDERVIEIALAGEFYDMAAAERVILIHSIVYTLTGLDFIDYVVFNIGGEPMVQADGSFFGRRNRENTSLGGEIEPVLTENVRVTLFFTCEYAEFLIAEERQIQIAQRQDVEPAIIRALIDGPISENLIATLPPETRYNRVVREADRVIVDFTSNFVNNLAIGSSGEIIMIYSIVNTLTELSGIRRVQFLIDGLNAATPWHLDLSEPIYRNETLLRNP